MPLLDVLQSLPPDKMKILISHLDDKTRDGLYETIALTLTSPKISTQRRMQLRKKLLSHKDHLRNMMQVRQGPCAKKVKLMQMGGGPMKTMLKAAIPLLLSSFKSNS